MDKKSHKVLFFLAVILGIAAPTFELLTGICSELFFNPIPTVWHGIVYYLMPLSMLLNYFLLKRDAAAEPKFVRPLSRWLIFFSITVSTAYSIWFLSIIWISLLALVAFGIGIFGLAPFYLLVFSLVQNKQWLTKYGNPKMRLAPAFGTVFGALLVVLLLWGPIMTGIAARVLQTDNENAKNFVLKALETTVNREQFHQECYYIPTIWDSWFEVDQDKDALKDAYFYIYGKTPGVPMVAPGIRRSRYVWDFDEALNSGVIGDTVHDLLLKESTMDVSSSFSGDNSYYEWTMVFENNGNWNAEARTIVQLPPDGFVSKVSLWMNGEEYPAAFGGRSQVTEAYREVVAHSRDPVLVSMIGQDLIQIECFPVPTSGTMQIRIGVTAPLENRTRVRLPHIVDCNYSIEPGFRHRVWIEADRPLTSHSGDQPASEIVKLSQSEQDFTSSGNYFDYESTPSGTYSYFNGALNLNYQSLPASEAKPILVVDGTREVLSKLSKLDWNAADYSEVIIARPYGYEVWDGKGDLRRFFASRNGYGGVNPVEALVYAADHALTGNYGDVVSGTTSSWVHPAILWLHGALPYDKLETAVFDQYERRSAKFRVVAVPVGEGYNALLSDIRLMTFFRSIPVGGDAASDISNGYYLATRDVPAEPEPGTVYLGGHPDSGAVFAGRPPENQNSQAYRIYMYSRAMSDWYADAKMSDVNVTGSIRARIVTPVVGAVVLESQTDYERANLDPTVGAENIPSIPEPEWIWFLVILGAAATVSVFVYRRKKQVKA